jgi:hypothetical protein
MLLVEAGGGGGGVGGGGGGGERGLSDGIPPLWDNNVSIRSILSLFLHTT